jgi:hypothetical protein
MVRAASCGVICIVLLGSADVARSETGTPAMGALLEEMRRMSERVETLEREREADQSRIRELEDALARLESSSRGGSEADAGVGSGSDGLATALGQGNLFNPEITVFGDLGGSLSTDGDDKRFNRFNLREFELDFRAAVTPWVDGALILALGEEIEQEAGEAEIHTHVHVEEGYLNFHTLPYDLALKAGKFRASFGRNNLLHTHDLPQVTRPLAVEAFLGPEGLMTIGGSLSWIVPNPWERYVEIVTEVVNSDGGEESPIFGGPNARNPALISHLKLFEDVGDWSSLEVGGSFLFGRTSDDADSRAYLLGLDATYLWRDPSRPDFRSLLLQGEVFWGSNDWELEGGGVDRNRSLGFYALGQYQFAQNWYAGLRYDYTEFPNLEFHDGDDSEWALTSSLSWYFTEFLRLRLEYQHRSFERFGDDGDQDNLMLQLTFVLGAHPAHPYWVNR